MIIDGNKIAEEVVRGLKMEMKKILEKTGKKPEITLGVVLVGNDPMSVKYVNKKKILAEKIGVRVKIFNFDEKIHEDELARRVTEAVKISDGVIVQLPLPKHIEAQKILDLIPKEKDIDCLSEDSAMRSVILSPVVEAISEIFSRADLTDLRSKKIVVVGEGKLVGKPVFHWLKEQNYDVSSFSKSDSDNIYDEIKKSDVLILAAGSPGLIKKEMLKDDVVLIDVSTSEVSGMLKGDAESDCADKCSVFTPVPGGVGPLTVVMLFKNLFELWKRNNNNYH